MDNNIVLLIVVVIIILLIIVLASPTCRHAVTGVLKGKHKSIGPVKDATRRERGRKELTRGSDLVAEAAKPLAKGDATRQERARKYASEALERNTVGATAPPAPVQKKEPLNGYRQVGQHSVPENVPVLNGPVESLFNPKMDLEGEFGINEAQLSQMAKDYQKRHLTAEKPQLARSRHVRRGEQEEAEEVMRQSYVRSNKVSQARVDSEDLIVDAMKQGILAQKRNGEHAGKSVRSRKFATKKQ